MKLYVMRHGPAEDHSRTGRDADRALTPSGRERVRVVAEALVASGEAPLAILSSPLARALQTAEIVASVAANPTVEVRRELAPGGDKLGLLAELVRDARKRVMIVGHEPELSGLVERLVGRAPADGMSKGMVVGAKLVPTEPGVEGLGFTSAFRFELDPKTLTWTRD